MHRRTIAGLVLVGMLPHASLGAQQGTIRGTISVPSPGITAVAVYLVPATATVPAFGTVRATIDQRDLQFVPRVIAVTPGSTVSFPNSDPVLHNVFHPARRTEAFDLGTYPPGEERSFTFTTEGAFVIFCRMHPEMVAYVVVVASPYRAVTGADGRFQLAGVPPGTYHLRTGHRRLRSLDRLVTVPRNGTVSVDVTLEYGFPVEPQAAKGGAPR